MITLCLDVKKWSFNVNLNNLRASRLRVSLGTFLSFYL